MPALDRYKAVTFIKEHCYCCCCCFLHSVLLPLPHFGAKWTIGLLWFVLYIPMIWVFYRIYACTCIWVNSEGDCRLSWGRRVGHQIWWRCLYSILMANSLIQILQLKNRSFFCFFYQTLKICFWEYFPYNFLVWELHSSNKHHTPCCHMPTAYAGHFLF